MDGTILLVEDEAPLREGIQELLAVHGFTVEAVGDGSSALRSLARGGFSLVVLDLMIPPPSGLEVLSRMRAAGDSTPVLVLTARGTEADVVEGLERGADDYVTKPFGVKELVARVKGLLRRSTGAVPSPRVSLGEAVLDVTNARLEYGAGERLCLTAREAALLAYLAAHRGRVIPRAELLVQVWGYRDGTIETRTVDVHVQKLRQRLGALPGGSRWVETVRGVGYRLGV
ncbi:MAG: response regulator transcription factor [Deltaproteobacteria bacterium]|nr:response regulator transcription factor [Deltaproteobacteria bacterium]